MASAVESVTDGAGGPEPPPPEAWQVAEPESVKDAPAIGTNCQS